MAQITLSDLVPGGGWINKALQLAVEGLTADHKQQMLDDLKDGKSLNELHDYKGTMGHRVGPQIAYHHVVGLMTLPENGNWQCYGVFSEAGTQSQVSFQLTIDPDPNNTSKVLTIKHGLNTPGAPAAKTYTVKDCYFKFDVDGFGGGLLTGAGEVGVVYHHSNGDDRTMVFTSQKKSLL